MCLGIWCKPPQTPPKEGPCQHTRLAYLNSLINTEQVDMC
jgi:hypothetical protein